MVLKKEETIKILDESGDKKYFTIVPNYILNHSTSDEQALYLQMKRFAGEKGECFASQGTMGKKLGWNRQRVSRTIQKLLKRGWISGIGVKKMGMTRTNVYKIIDLWKKNADFYSQNDVKPENIVLQNDVKPENNTDVKPENTKKNQKEEKPVSVRATSRLKNIIKLFAFFKGVPRPTNSFFKRNVRAAKELLEYEEGRVEDVMGWLSKHADFKWTLESVAKYIDEDLEDLRARQRFSRGDWKCQFGYWHQRGEICGHTAVMSRHRQKRGVKVVKSH